MNHTRALHKGQSVELPDARGAVLRVLRGRVWLTQQRDGRDIVLQAGDAWAVDQPGLTVAQAQVKSTVQITHRACLASRMTRTARQPWLERLHAWIARSVANSASPRFPYY